MLEFGGAWGYAGSPGIEDIVSDGTSGDSPSRCGPFFKYHWFVALCFEKASGGEASHARSDDPDSQDRAPRSLSTASAAPKPLLIAPLMELLSVYSPAK